MNILDKLACLLLAIDYDLIWSNGVCQSATAMPVSMASKQYQKHIREELLRRASQRYFLKGFSEVALLRFSQHVTMTTIKMAESHNLLKRLFVSLKALNVNLV